MTVLAKMFVLLVVVVGCCFSFGFTVADLENSRKPKPRCEPIQNPICRKFASQGYNLTTFPNSVKHRSAAEANYEITQYKPLIQVDCSPDLTLFLCSLYFPYCLPEGNQKSLPPCRSLCESARNGCNNLMVSFGFEWPYNCTVYPEETNGFCMGRKMTPTTVPPPVTGGGGGGKQGKKQKGRS